MGSVTNKKLFDTRKIGKTIIRYSEWWLEVVRYIWRIHVMPEASPGGEVEEVEGKRPALKLTAKQLT